jgi:phosphatidylserine decarboxylase
VCSSDLGVQIGIFMGLMDVHVNRSPCGGRIAQISRQKGSFLDARDPHAWENNESVTVRIVHNHNGADHVVVVRQIAGLIARRIVTELAEGETVLRGQRIGMIKFGSRVELLAPSELAGEIPVQVGQKVYAGQSVLAIVDKGRDDAAGPARARA